MTKHLLTYDFFKDAVVWFPEQRIIIVVDNDIETIQDCEKRVVFIQGKNLLVAFPSMQSTFDVARYNKMLANFQEIDPFHSSKGDQNYKRWYFYSDAENITVILCSSYGYSHFLVSKQYFLARKKELDARAVVITAKYLGTY